MLKKLFTPKQKPQPKPGQTVDYFATCWRCDGTGKLFHNDNNRWQICPVCHGDGTTVEIKE